MKLDKQPFITKSFFHFFFSFVAIIAVAFGIMIWAGLALESPVEPDINVAVPR